MSPIEPLRKLKTAPMAIMGHKLQGVGVADYLKQLHGMPG
jgi:hypothetical protein